MDWVKGFWGRGLEMLLLAVSVAGCCRAQSFPRGYYLGVELTVGQCLMGFPRQQSRLVWPEVLCWQGKVAPLARVGIADFRLKVVLT